MPQKTDCSPIPEAAPETEQESKMETKPGIKAWLAKNYQFFLDFVHNDLWLTDIRSISSRSKRWFFRFLRFIRMVANIQGFSQISKNAQALTYMAGLSVIPMLSVALWLTSGTLWNYFKQLFGSLLPADASLQTILHASGIAIPDAVLNRLSTMEGSLSGLSFFSVVILIGSIALTLLGVEDNVNDVYGIKRSRSYPKRLLVWSGMVIGAPILPIIIMAFPGRHLINNMWERMRPGLLTAKETLQSSMAAGIQRKADLDRIINQVTGPIKDALLTKDTIIFALLVFVSIAVIFAVLYKALPYTKVNISASIPAGLMASFAWSIWDLIFIIYILWPGTTSKIYGSLAVIPFFFLWLYVSWVIFLYGAKICYAIQYSPNYDPAVENGQYATKELERICCRIFEMLQQKWQLAKSPEAQLTMGQIPLYTIEELVAELKVPLRIVERAVSALENAKLIKTAGRDNVRRPVLIYLTCDCDETTLSIVQAAAREEGAQRKLPLAGPQQEPIDALLQAGSEAESAVLSKAKFKDLKA